MGGKGTVMQSRLLRHFLAVAERRNITAAAGDLHISQPALTRSIRQLEATVGTPLFERLPTGVVLTRQGEVLARRAKLMDLEYRHALAEINALKEGLAGVLRIAAGPMWLMTLLPAAIAAFQIQFPKIKVRLTEGVIDTVVPALLGGEIDVACITLNFPAHAEVVKEPLLGIRHLVYARDKHPLAGHNDIAPQELLKYPWVVLANDTVGTSRIGSFFLANSLDPPNIAVETSAVGMLNLLAAGDYLGMFPAAAQPYTHRFGLRPIRHEGTFWEAEAGIAHLRSSRPARIIESFKAILRSTITS
jgi:DNA-binding transcriptional LysR family regulator